MKNEIGAIWHSAEGKPWRAKFREIQMKSGMPVTEPELSEEAKSVKDEILEEIRAKKAKAESATKVETPVNVAEMQNSIANLKKENGDLKAKLIKVADSFDRMERSYGMAAAKVIVNVPFSSGNSHSLIDIFNEMPDGPDKTKFYQEHKAEISQFINKPKAS